MLDTVDVSKKFGKFVRIHRAKCDLTQAEVADLVGISQVQYSRIERGLRVVDLPLSMRICETLRTDITEFIRDYIEV